MPNFRLAFSLLSKSPDALFPSSQPSCQPSPQGLLFSLSLHVFIPGCESLLHSIVTFIVDSLGTSTRRKERIFTWTTSVLPSSVFFIFPPVYSFVFFFSLSSSSLHSLIVSLPSLLSSSLILLSLPTFSF